MSRNHSPSAPRLVLAACSVALFGFSTLVSAQSPFRRGDANADGRVDLNDSARLVDAIFNSNPLDCEDAGDANDDGSVNLGDIVFINFFIGLDGAPPDDPGPYECDIDPTADSIDCVTYDAPCVNFRRGDANGDGEVTEADATYVLDFLFTEGPTPDCEDAADANDSGVLEFPDVFAILNFVNDGTLTSNPGPADCGPDPTAGDTLDCASYTASCNEFLRGDANSDGTVSTPDALLILNVPGTITCEDAADANDDGVIDETDADFILEYLFNNGDTPAFPGPTWGGRDVLTPDALGCDSP